MKQRPWNEKVENRAFWDANADDGRGLEFIKSQTLKESLQNFGQMKYEDFMRTLAAGLLMVMEAIDATDQKPPPEECEHDMVPDEKCPVCIKWIKDQKS